jgi:hypothetical protein
VTGSPNVLVGYNVPIGESLRKFRKTLAVRWAQQCRWVRNTVFRCWLL